ncbi:MAG: ribosome maturation factor RimM, partial [Coleofasciculaceae cyanobacterium SM2_3_26]|nr:ribosome maturation factor RimM [Coleofasciculaceae cyanobacterium SM2_3_26]
VRVYPDSDFPERFLVPGTRWLQRSPQSDPEPVALLRGRYIPGKNLFVLRLEGVETREQAEALRNAVLLVPADSRPTLAEGEYHVADLVGLEVFDRTTQTAIGVVVDVMTAGNDLLQVKLHESVASNSKERLPLIPFVEAIVPVVDLVAGRVEIEPPEGLLEL